MAVQGKKISNNKKDTTKTKSGKQDSKTKKEKAKAKAAAQARQEAEERTRIIQTLNTNSANRNSAMASIGDVSTEGSDMGRYGNTYITDHDDGGASARLTNPNSNPIWSQKTVDGENYPISNKDSFTDLKHSVNIFSRSEIDKALYSKTFRFGLLNPYGSISTAREYLFFTKPDLNIFDTDESLIVSKSNLQEGLASIPFWMDFAANRKSTTIASLQLSMNKDDPFNHLLQNTVASNLDIPSLSAELTETPTNIWGVNYSYRGSSESSDDNPEFSLEFKDTRYLDVFNFFKGYEEYETLKHHGVIRPSKYYIKNKILHDQFAIYKFIVDEDMETILYYGKMYGVFPKSLPREVFSSPTFDNGLTFSVDFKAAFYEDMKPDILADFNKLSKTVYNQQKYQLSPYNPQLDHADMRPAGAAFVYKVKNTGQKNYTYSPTGYVYKLKWRGGDTI